MISLTDRQIEILDFVREHTEDMGFPPTNKDIADHFDITPKGAHDHLKAIEKKGWITIIPGIARGIRING